MGKFPGEESKILGLAQEMTDGFAANTTLYPNPPINTEDLNASLAACIAARDAIQAAKSAMEEAMNAKNAAFDALREKMRKDIRYAENMVNYDNAKLKLIGWSGRRTGTPLTVPGQVRSLMIRNQGEGSVTLAWKKPSDGGRVAAYKIKLRERAQGSAWISAEAALETEITLKGQERGKVMELCVVAANKAGDGVESNTVTAIF